ncbi:MAG: hypothetical protein Q4A83_05875 [Bacillota bacterium]|nr:hypothetical protein [Bacillota bacterium]
MKRTVCALLALMLLFSLCACGNDATPEETPEATERILTETDKWAMHIVNRYNMDYEDFAEYWSLLCDNYFGEDFISLLNILSDCENVNFSMEEKNAEIADKRSEYEKEYGTDLRFEYKECVLEPLEDRANEDFAAELEGLYDSICVLTGEAAQWSDTSWNYFAEGLGCDTETAKQVVELYAAMGEKCHEATVEEASAATVILLYGDSETAYNTWLYKVNGVYVSQSLIDNASALINLIY